jgi:hypothetical protein
MHGYWLKEWINEVEKAPLFASVVQNMGELPRLRHSQIARKSKTIALHIVPA